MSGKFGSAALAANIVTQIGAAVAAGKVWTVNVRFANRNSDASEVFVWVGSGANEADADCVTPGTPVAGKRILEDTGIVVSAGEKVWVKSSVANVSVRVHGHSKEA